MAWQWAKLDLLPVSRTHLGICNCLHVSSSLYCLSYEHAFCVINIIRKSQNFNLDLADDAVILEETTGILYQALESLSEKAELLDLQVS